MDQIVQQISERTGIPEAQAREAAQVVIGYLKEHLPAPVAAQIDGLLTQNLGDMAKQAQDLIGGLGGMFGKQ